MEEKVPHKSQNPNYFVRLFLHGKEGLSLLDIMLDGAAALIMTAIVLAVRVFGKSEAEGLYLSAIIYSVVFFILAFCIHVVLKAPYKIIKEQDKTLSEFEERLRPKFKLSCPKGDPSCVVPSLNGSLLFLRICVETDCPEGIKNCSGRLLRIEKDGIPVFNCDTISLPFSKSEDPDSLAKTVSPKIKYNVDILSIVKVVHCIMVAAKPPYPLLDQNRDYPFNESGDYILDVAVCGDAPTETIRLRFTWGRQWDSARIEEIK
jgi:hypothetical protein